MRKCDTQIINKLGLHARAATKLSQLAGKYSCQINIEFNDKIIDAKSIMSLMLLAASKGSMIHISTQGQDEDEAMEGLLAMIKDRFGEEE